MTSFSLMHRAPEPDPMMIRKHLQYFRPCDTARDSPNISPDGLPILRWNVFLAGPEPTPCYSPVISFQHAEIDASNRLWRAFCPKWARFGDIVSYYKKQIQSHAQRLEQIRALSNVPGTPFAIFCSVLKRGEPSAALDFFREHPFGEWRPTREQLARIIRILKERVEQQIKAECANADIINLAVDGWSDQRGRRYQAVTARLVLPGTLEALTHLLAMKEIRSVHESTGELRAMVETCAEALRYP
jgi:hypothetical protein